MHQQFFPLAFITGRLNHFFMVEFEKNSFESRYRIDDAPANAITYLMNFFTQDWSTKSKHIKGGSFSSVVVVGEMYVSTLT